MENLLPISRVGLVLSLGALLLGGCRDQLGLNPVGPEAAQNSPEEVAIAPALANGQNLVCDTPGYQSTITWNGDQASFSFLQKPNIATLAAVTPVTITNNPDGSRTFGHTDDTTTTYTRFFPTEECFVQVLTSAGAILVEQNGSMIPTGELMSAVVNAVNTDNRYQEGYDRGLTRGFSDGENFRRFNSGYNPDAAFQAGSTSGDADYDKGYREGFYQGFEQGYNNFIAMEPPTPVAEPNQDDLAMTCAGTIQNDVDFTVSYTREAGFNRAVFRPRRGNQSLTAQLAYDGKDNLGHGIWRGNVAQMADVVLVHLSSQAPQPNDQVSVGYDNRWGRANCR